MGGGVVARKRESGVGRRRRARQSAGSVRRQQCQWKTRTHETFEAGAGGGGAAAAASSSGVSESAATATARSKPLRIIIAGAPASGKGTQCELIVRELGLTHISAGDLLREQVSIGSENGRIAKEYMDRGDLVPDGVVIDMVKARLACDDAQSNGWLLDGYPRSGSQASALEEAGIRPELFIVLEVPDEVLIERVIGRRLDPETGKIYHMIFDPPPEEIAGRLTTRSDDTEEKARNRLATHEKNVNAVVDNYKDIICYLDGNRAKNEVFADIRERLLSLVEA